VGFAIPADDDVNHNALPDWWEYQYFGSLQSPDAWIQSYAGDSIPNGVKFALVANPTKPMPAARLPQASYANGQFLLTYRQQRGGTGAIGVDYTVHGLTYRVSVYKPDAPYPFFHGTNAVQWTGYRQDNGDDSETVQVRSLLPGTTNSLGFMRLELLY
jgi:hypothetical protein